jgi:restriction system protein
MNKKITNGIVPNYEKLIYPTLKAIIALGGSGSIDEIEEKIIELEKYTQEVVEVTHKSGWKTLLSYRLAWARTYLKKVDALTNSSKGVWTLTDSGKKIDEKYCLEIPKIARRKFKPKNEIPENINDDIPPEEIANISSEEWKGLLLEELYSLKPEAFERLCQRILRESGFIKVQVMGQTGDRGVDGEGVLRINLVTFTVIFQCKRYRESVGSSVVREFRGTVQGRCDKGLIITTGVFTSEAKKEAIRTAPTIDLIDGDHLCELLKSLNLGVNTELVEKVTISPVWFRDI